LTANDQKQTGAGRLSFHQLFSVAGTGCPRLQEVSVHDELHHARSLGLSVALGGAMGAAIGAATGHIGIWVAAGIAIYIAITLVGSLGREKSNGN
jgi:hypothetical protein